jgi:hypothetical protein
MCSLNVRIQASELHGIDYSRTFGLAAMPFAAAHPEFSRRLFR